MFHSSLCPHHRPVRKTSGFLMPLRHHACAPPGAHPARGANHPCLSLLQRSPAFFGVVVQGKGFFGGAPPVAAKSRRCESGLERIDLIDFQYHGLIAAAWLARFLPEQLEVTGSCAELPGVFFAHLGCHRFSWVERYVTVRYICIIRN